MRHWRTTFLTNSVLLGSGLVSGVLLARTLGADDRGLLAAVTYWPHFIVGIVAMGMNEGIVLQIASSGRSKATVITAMMIAIVLAIVAAVTCWILLSSALGTTREAYLGFARAYAWVLAFSSYTCLCLLAVYQGEMQFSQFNSIRVLQTGAYPLALVCLWMFDFLTVQTAACAALLGGVVVALLLLYRFSSDLIKRPSLEEGKAILSKSTRLHLVNIMMSLTEQFDKMILVIWSSNSQLGKYVVAYTAAAAGPAVLAQTYINVMLPSAARTQGDSLRYEAIMKSLKKMILLVMISAAIIILVLPVLLPLAFGKDFAAATSYARVLTIALSIHSIRKCIIYLLRSWQVSIPAMRAEALTASCILAGGYLAFMHAGVMGMCWLLVAAQSIGAVSIWKDFLVSARSRYTDAV